MLEHSVCRCWPSKAETAAIQKYNKNLNCTLVKLSLRNIKTIWKIFSLLHQKCVLATLFACSFRFYHIGYYIGEFVVKGFIKATYLIIA